MNLTPITREDLPPEAQTVFDFAHADSEEHGCASDRHLILDTIPAWPWWGVLVEHDADCPLITAAGIQPQLPHARRAIEGVIDV